MHLVPFVMIASGFMFSCATTAPRLACSDSPCRLVVLHTNDHHGHPVAFDAGTQKAVGGLPARARFVENVRKQEEHLLVVDAGDINTGRPESSLFDAESDIVGYNHIRYDAVTLGNHEFYKGPNVLAKQISQAQFPLLSANADFSHFPALQKVKPYVIKSFGNFTVAILGLTTPSTVETAQLFAPHLKMENPIDTARRLVPELRRQADVVIALTHLGEFPEDDPTTSTHLAQNVAGIDIVVDGHTHTRLSEPLWATNKTSGKKIPIVQTGAWGIDMGRLALTISKGEVRLSSYELKPISGEQDEALAAKLSPYLKKVESLLGEFVFQSPQILAKDGVRERETQIGNLLGDATYWYAKTQGAQCALHNAGGIRTALPAGGVTKKSIYEALPFDNSVVILSVSGQDLTMLLHSLAQKSLGTGAFPVVANMSFSLNVASGEARDIRIGGKPIQPGEMYRVATNSYLAMGGDIYTTFKNAREKNDTSVFVRDVLVSYLKQKLELPQVEGRIRIVGTAAPKAP